MTAAVTATSVYRSGRHRRAAHRRGRFIWLHARARAAPSTAAGVAIAGLSAWISATWLVHREFSAGAADRVPVAVGAPLVAVVLVSIGLSGTDEEMEGSTAARWWRIRAIHVLAAAAVAGSALGLGGLWEPQTYGAFELARNTVGYLGIVLVSAVLLGAGLAWVPVFGYVTTMYLASAQSQNDDIALWAWPVQQASVTNASWVAAAAGAFGLVVYSAWGSRIP